MLDRNLDRKTILEKIEAGEIDVEPFSPETLNLPDAEEREALKDDISKRGIIEPLTVTFDGDMPLIVNGNVRYSCYKKLVADGKWKFAKPEVMEVPFNKAEELRNAEFFHKDKTKLQRAIYGEYHYGDTIREQADKNKRSGKETKTSINSNRKIGKIVGCGETYVSLARKLLEIDKEFFYDFIFNKAQRMTRENIDDFCSHPDDQRTIIDRLKKVKDDRPSKGKTLYDQVKNKLSSKVEAKQKAITNAVLGGEKNVEKLLSGQSIYDANKDKESVDETSEYTYTLKTNKPLHQSDFDFFTNYLDDKGISSSIEFIKSDIKPYQILMELSDVVLPSYWLSKEQILDIISVDIISA